jgi:GNAT superfamily N-acetyltransferase
MNREPFEPLRIQRASLVDQTAALSMVYAHLAPADRERRIAAQGAESPTAAAEGLWVGYRGELLAAAVLAQILPGKTALISAPRVAANQAAETASQLLTPIMAQLSRDGVQLAQALLEAEHAPDALVFRELGFHYVCDLLFLVSVRGSFPQTQPQDHLEFVSYSHALHRRLAEIVERTYAGSLDCPEIDGVRKLNDILTGYRETGVFDPARWMIVRHQGVDVGCLLLTDHPSSNQWELIYMGVVREARGRRFGVAMARRAQWMAGQGGHEQLVLAVDANNAPAIAAYTAAGFVAWDHRSLFLRVL